MEIETETLTEEAYKVDEFAGKVTLLVEAQVIIPACTLLSWNSLLSRIYLQGMRGMAQSLGNTPPPCMLTAS